MIFMTEDKQKTIAWIGSGRNYEKIISSLSTIPNTKIEHFPDLASFLSSPKRSYDLYVSEARMRSGMDSRKLPEMIFQGDEDKIALLAMREAKRREPLKMLAVPHLGAPEEYQREIHKAGANAIINVFKNTDNFFINLAGRFLQGDYSQPIPSD